MATFDERTSYGFQESGHRRPGLSSKNCSNRGVPDKSRTDVVQRIFSLIRSSRDTLCRSQSKEDVLKNKEGFEDAACNAMRWDAVQCNAMHDIV